ncbi:MAG: FAD-dependent monooxygenase, partial [Chlamydiae bacterium]|nr:FAD-dependent monooxygenase [Chlamydiota bacterium]
MNKILICGAGPVGLTLAIQCARYGVEFILIEKEKEKPLYSKALAIWSGVQETFEAIGVDISGSAVALEYMQIILEGVPQKIYSRIHR